MRAPLPTRNSSHSSTCKEDHHKAFVTQNNYINKHQDIQSPKTNGSNKSLIFKSFLLKNELVNRREAGSPGSDAPMPVSPKLPPTCPYTRPVAPVQDDVLSMSQQTREKSTETWK
jgi:hypothetical protein